MYGDIRASIGEDVLKDLNVARTFKQFFLILGFIRLARQVCFYNPQMSLPLPLPTEI